MIHNSCSKQTIQKICNYNILHKFANDTQFVKEDCPIFCQNAISRQKRMFTAKTLNS